jgi:hypothetical protein
MKQDNPFAKLGALDQKLYQDTATQDKAKPSVVETPSVIQRPAESKKQDSSDTMVPRHHDAMISSTHDTATPFAQQDILEVVRKSVKQIGKEAATHRFTADEKAVLADIEYTYQRQGIKTSENEITRIAINYLTEDYQRHGEQSILAKSLKRLNS